MNIKQLLIIALFEHLHQQEVLGGFSEFFRKKAKERTGYSAAVAITNVWHYDRRIKEHKRTVDILTLLISPPLFYDALDLRKHGKVSRFVEAES